MDVRRRKSFDTLDGYGGAKFFQNRSRLLRNRPTLTRAVKALREAPWIKVRKGRFCNSFSPAFDLVQHINARLALVREARRARYPIRKPNPRKST
jgi:hypothetical protein